MKKNISAGIIRFTRLIAFVFTVMALTSGMNAMTVKAAETETAFSSDMYDEINTLGAAVTVKTNSLKAVWDKKAFTYKAQKPVPTKVTVNGVNLAANKDYTVSYQCYREGLGWQDVAYLAEPGTYRIRVDGIDRYEGSATVRIYVYDAVESVPMTAVSVAVNKMPYTEKPITGGVLRSVKYKKATLVEGKDYIVSYLNNMDSGNGIVRLTAVGGSGYVGEKDVTFQITGGTALGKANVTGITDKIYDAGCPVTQDMSRVQLTFKDRKLEQDKDYSVLYYMNNTEAGTAKIVIAGKGWYNGSITKTFKINKVKLHSGMLDKSSGNIVVEHTGKAVMPEVTLYHPNGEPLVRDVDYTLAYKNNVDPSDKAVVTVKGKGNYTGSFNVNFTIRDKEENPANPGTKDSESGETEDGGMYDETNTLGAAVTVKTNSLKAVWDKKAFAYKAQKLMPTKVTVNGVNLKANRDYTVSYQYYLDGWRDVNEVDGPGMYRLCVNGAGNYRGVATRRIYVYEAAESKPMTAVSVAVNKMPYTGEPITGGVLRSVKYKNATLVKDKDYTVSYLNNRDSGNGIVRLTAVDGSGYVGEKDVTFQITGGTALGKAKVTGVTDKTYEGGRAVEQDMSGVKLTLGGGELQQGTDYVVSYYMNNTKVGTAKIVFTGKGKYNGTLTKTFKINKVKISSDMLDGDSANIVALYTKKAVKPDVTLYNDGTQLVKGVDYTLAYKNNVKMSDKAVITVTGKGNYTGSFNVSFTIVDKIEEKVKEPDPKEEDPKEEETDGNEETKPTKCYICRSCEHYEFSVGDEMPKSFDKHLEWHVKVGGIKVVTFKSVTYENAVASGYSGQCQCTVCSEMKDGEEENPGESEELKPEEPGEEELKPEEPGEEELKPEEPGEEEPKPEELGEEKPKPEEPGEEEPKPEEPGEGSGTEGSEVYWRCSCGVDVYNYDDMVSHAQKVHWHCNCGFRVDSYDGLIEHCMKTMWDNDGVYHNYGSYVPIENSMDVREEIEKRTREKEQAEREAAEQAAREQAESEAAEQAAREQAEREAAEQAEREQAEREAAEQAIAREEAEKATGYTSGSGTINLGEQEKAARYHCNCGFSTTDYEALKAHMMQHALNGERNSYCTTYE